jgi:Fic family protein
VDEQRVFDALGFRWDRGVVTGDVPVHSVERAVFRLHKSLPEYVWDAAVLEGNPFTFPDVQTLMDGVTVGGHRLGDERQVLNLVESARELLRLVKEGGFALDKATSDHLHAIIARDEAFDAGHFRGEGQEQRLTPGVSLGQHGRYLPEPTEPGGENLRRLHSRGLAATIEGLASTYEQAVVYFLFGALQQFYFDGNKRTSRYLMNGHLMSHGIDAISVPAARAREFNTLMVDFFRFRDGTRMVAFLTDCHPDADEIMTPGMRALLA